MLTDGSALASPEVAGLVAAHLHDLIALRVGATSDAAAVAEERGVRAARLRAMSISSIAYDVGFGDLSYFNRAFRRRYDATPSDIRNRRAVT